MRTPALPTLRTRLIPLATAAVLSLGVIVAAAPATAAPVCKRVDTKLSEGAETAASSYRTTACIDLRSDHITANVNTTDFQLESWRKYPGSRYSRAHVQVALYENGRLVARSDCSATSTFNRKPGPEHRRATHSCATLSHRARESSTYQIRASLTIDYRWDDRPVHRVHTVIPDPRRA